MEFLPKLAQNVIHILTNPELQLEIINQFEKLYVGGDTQSVFQISLPFGPFRNSAPHEQRLTIPIFAAVISNVQKDIKIPHLEDIIEAFYSTLFYKTSDDFDDTICVALASIFNKIDNEQVINNFIDNKIIKSVLPFIQTNTNTLEQRKRLIKCFIWVIKGLIGRLHKKGNELWSLMQDLLENTETEISLSVAQQMVVLFKDERCLSNVKPIYKQKYFVTNLPRLISGFRNTQGYRETIYLLAVSNLLKFLPTSVLLEELPQLLPVILESIKVPLTTEKDSGSLQFATINIIILLVQEAPTSIEDHLGSLIPRLLDLSSNPLSNMTLRKIALTCLMLFARLSYIKIFPFKGQVLKQLKTPLDDKKRDVRKVAVKARNEWFTINSK